MDAYQFLVISTTLVVGFLLLRLIVSGVRSRGRRQFDEVVIPHQRRARVFFAAASLMVVTVDQTVRWHGGIIWGWFLITHITIAALFYLSAAILVFYYNGRRGLYHRRVAYFCAAAYCFAAVMGITMALERL